MCVVALVALVAVLCHFWLLTRYHIDTHTTFELLSPYPLTLPFPHPVYITTLEGCFCRNKENQQLERIIRPAVGVVFAVIFADGRFLGLG